MALVSLQRCRTDLRAAELHRRIGRVRSLQGLAIEAEGPVAKMGEMCRIVGRATARQSEGLLAEIVGFRSGLVTLMAYGATDGIAPGDLVVSVGADGGVPVGPELLGRVLDGFGNPLDGKAAPICLERRPLRSSPSNPLDRPRIKQVLETGVRSIDALLTVGVGQRVGVFAGSGVGKSTLLGMVSKHAAADVNVIALIGERGREVREFVEEQLGRQGLKRSVVIVATSDQPALSRIRAAYAALAVAAYFRDLGKSVMLTMDSMTRFAMARREVGLAAGEPATARGYTPSVFSELPQLCEVCGTSASGGAITALLTVLVEGDDFNEPISDHLRSILDGHIVLTRELAHRGQYPAIDVLQSASRLMPELTTKDEANLAREAVEILSTLERSRQMVELGAYERGSNPELDALLLMDAPLRDWLRQDSGGFDRSRAIRGLKAILAKSRQELA